MEAEVVSEVTRLYSLALAIFGVIIPCRDGGRFRAEGTPAEIICIDMES